MQLAPRIFIRETPLDLGAGGIAFFFQLLDLSLECFFVRDAPVKALTAKDTQLDLSDVEPTAMLRRVVKLQLLKYPPRFFRREPLIERGRPVRVQVVHHNPHPLGLRESNVHQPFHLLREVGHRSLLSNLNVPPSTLRFTEHKQVTHALALILIIEPLDSSARHRQRLSSLGNQLFARLIEADHRTLSVERFGIQIEYVLHRRDELQVNFPDAQLLFQPRLQPVFLSTWRTVSRAIEEAKPNST